MSSLCTFTLGGYVYVALTSAEAVAVAGAVDKENQSIKILKEPHHTINQSIKTSSQSHTRAQEKPYPSTTTEGSKPCIYIDIDREREVFAFM